MEEIAVLPEPPDPEMAQRLIGAVVAGSWGAFASHRGQVDEDDLKQRLYQRVLEAWPKYNPAKSQPQTHITTIAKRRLIDELRSCIRKKAQIERLGEMAPQFSAPIELNPLEYDADIPVAQWLIGVYANARKLYGVQRRTKNRFNVAQVVAISILMQRMNLTIRGVRQMLADRPEWREAIAMRETPGKSWFQSAVLVRTLFWRNSENSSPARDS